MTADEFGQIITELRWTQALVGFYLIRDPRTIRRWLSGEHKVPKVVSDQMLNGGRLLAFTTWLDVLESHSQESAK